MEDCLVCLRNVLLILILLGIPIYTLRLYNPSSLIIRGLASAIMSVFLYISLLSIFEKMNKKYVVLSLLFLPSIILSNDKIIFNLSVSFMYLVLFLISRIFSLGFLSLAWFVISFDYYMYSRMFSLLPFFVIFERRKKWNLFYILSFFLTKYTQILLIPVLVFFYFKQKELFRISLPTTYSRALLFSLPTISLLEIPEVVIFIQFTVCLVLLDILYVSISEYVRKKIGYSAKVETKVQDIIGVMGYLIFLSLIPLGLEKYIVLYFLSLYPLLFSTVFYLEKNIKELKKFL